MDKELVLREYAREEISNMAMEDLVQWYNKSMLDRRFFPNGDIVNVCDRDVLTRVIDSIDPMVIMYMFDNGAHDDSRYNVTDEWRQYDEDNQTFRSFDTPQDLFDQFGFENMVSAYIDSMPMKKVRDIWAQEEA